MSKIKCYECGKEKDVDNPEKYQYLDIACSDECWEKMKNETQNEETYKWPA